MAEENANVEKKIIVDEDWKGRVEAERSAAEQAQTPPEAAPAPARESAPPADDHLPEPGRADPTRRGAGKNAGYAARPGLPRHPPAPRRKVRPLGGA